MGADTRDLIIDKALDLFHAKGYTATGVMDITRAAGVPKGSFYHFFDSKEDLAVETVARYVDNLNTLLLDGPTGSPLQRIRHHFEHITDLAGEEGYERGCLLGNFSTEMPSQSKAVSLAVEDALAAWTHKLADTIRAAQDAGEMTGSGDPEVLAGFIVAGFEGALSRAKVSQSMAPVHGFFDLVFNDLLR